MMVEVFPGPAGQSILSVKYDSLDMARELRNGPQWPFLLELRPSPFRTDCLLSPWGYWLSLSELLLQPLDDEILKHLIEAFARVYKTSLRTEHSFGLHWDPDEIFFSLVPQKDGKFGLDLKQVKFILEGGADLAEAFFSKIVELYFLNREGPLTEESERWLLARDETWPRLIEVILEKSTTASPGSPDEWCRARRESTAMPGYRAGVYIGSDAAENLPLKGPPAGARPLGRNDEQESIQFADEELWKPRPMTSCVEEIEELSKAGKMDESSELNALSEWDDKILESCGAFEDESDALKSSESTTDNALGDIRFKAKTKRIPSHILPPVLPLACLTDQAPGNGQLKRGRLFWIEGAVILGSSPELADFLIRDPRVLPEHCLIRAHTNHYSIQQLGITGSVKLDGVDLPPDEEVELPEQCILEVGSTKLYFFVDSLACSA